MRVLIETIPFDEHAAAIRWLLERRGHRADFYFASDFPVRQSVSIKAGAAGCSARLHAVGMEQTQIYEAGVVRRRRGPRIAADLHPADREFALRQSRIVGDALKEFVNVSGWWVNPPASSHRYDSKPIQLKEAILAGLRIPETLISNDLDEVQHFIASAGRDVICKPLQPAVWKNSKTSRLTFTRKVSVADIQSRESSVRYAPSIFQHYVRKQAEVRVVVMGHTVFAYEVASARRVEVTDWRTCYADGTGLRVKLVSLPSSLVEQVLDFMSRIDIVFGCFDFCIDENGDHIFLEVNPMGQFLWLEKEPSTPALLSAFCDFLESSDPCFRSSGSRDDFRFSDAMETDAYGAIFAEYSHHDASNNDCFTYPDEEPSEAVA